MGLTSPAVGNRRDDVGDEAQCAELPDREVRRSAMAEHDLPLDILSVVVLGLGPVRYQYDLRGDTTLRGRRGPAAQHVRRVGELRDPFPLGRDQIKGGRLTLPPDGHGQACVRVPAVVDVRLPRYPINVRVPKLRLDQVVRRRVPGTPPHRPMLRDGPTD